MYNFTKILAHYYNIIYINYILTNRKNVVFFNINNIFMIHKLIYKDKTNQTSIKHLWTINILSTFFIADVHGRTTQNDLQFDHSLYRPNKW